MKFLQILPTLAQGGAEKFTIDLCNSLSSTEDVDLLSLYAISGEELKIPDDSFNLIKYGFSSWRKILIPFFLLFTMLKGKYDVVHMHLMTIIYSLPMIVFFPKCKYVYTFHGCPSYDHYLVKKVITFLSKKTKVHFVAVSEDVGRLVEEFYPSINIIVIENGTTRPRISNSDLLKEYPDLSGKVIFLNIARANSIKNQLELVKSFANVTNDKVLVIIGALGTDTYSEQLSTLVNENDNVYHLGFQSDVGSFIAMSDFTIISSLHEGLPISFIESLSLGVPVMTTPISTLKSIVIDNRVGIVFDGYDSSSIQVVLENLDIKNNYESMSCNARRLYESIYTMDSCMDKYKGLYAKK